MVQLIRKTRVLKKEAIEAIRYIQHLGPEPYNKVFFFDEPPKVVSYSLNYWQTVLGEDFERINKGNLVRKSEIKEVTKTNVELHCGTQLTLSRRKHKQVAALVL